MALTLQDVEKIARLSRLALSEDEKQKHLVELNGIFTIIEQMQSIDTTKVEPLSHPHDGFERLREDVVTQTNQRESFQAVAPSVKEGLYLVPRVIE